MNLTHTYFRKPELLNAEERFSEIAQILARGLGKTKRHATGIFDETTDQISTSKSSLNQLATNA